MMSWLKSGKISDTSTFVDGFENLPQGILGLFKGTNTGKMPLVVAEQGRVLVSMNQPAIGSVNSPTKTSWVI